jgi:hypothetical protein
MTMLCQRNGCDAAAGVLRQMMSGGLFSVCPPRKAIVPRGGRQTNEEATDIYLIVIGLNLMLIYMLFESCREIFSIP